METRQGSLRDADALLSHLVMGFIERRVAPQTIADIILAQVSESGAHPEDFQPATLNGVIESIAGSNAATGLQEIMVFLSPRRDFPEFLSGPAAMAGLAALLANPLHGLSESDRRFLPFCHLLDELSSRVLHVLQTSPSHAVKVGKVRLTNAIKATPGLISALAEHCPHLVILRQTVLKRTDAAVVPSHTEWNDVATVLTAIRGLPDSVLVHRSPAEFLAAHGPCHGMNKLSALDTVITLFRPSPASNALLGSDWTSFKRSFVVEWLFTGCLEAVLGNTTVTTRLGQSLRQLLSETELALDALKGVVRALQKDLCALVSPALKEHQPLRTSMPEEDLRTAALVTARSLFFGAVQPNEWLNPSRPGAAQGPVTFEERQKEFMAWVYQYPCDPAEFRMITRVQMSWLRLTETGEWSEGLAQPPSWIVEKASQNAAWIFQLAPGHWLQAHAASFVEVLWKETLHSDFQVGPAHLAYIEFLIRSMRKKSPLFASELGLLICLQILGRAQATELSQIKLAHTRLKMTEHPGRPLVGPARAILDLLEDEQEIWALGPHPAARALSLLARTAREVEMKSAKLQIHSDGFRVRS